ncbi:MAG: TetR family transcriptional regulator [Dehalococcoidia bacterium]|nr:TetR family transcriptional regulator [Dehalococcoidia bacterium]
MADREPQVQPAPEGKEATRQRILDAAAEVFSEKGYHGAAVDDIVRASQTSKGSFYFHFPSKQEIFFALVDRLTAALALSAREAIGREHGALAKVNAALETVLYTFSRHRQLAKILLVGGVGLGKAFDERLLTIHARFASLIKGHLDEAVAEGSIPPLDTEVTAYAWLGAVNEVIVRWLYTGQPEPLEAAMDTLRRLLLHSICAEGIEREEVRTKP